MNDLTTYINNLIKTFGGSQIPEEFIDTLNFLNEQDINHVLEIGSSSGLSMMGWGVIAKGKKISVDLPFGLFGGQTPDNLEKRNLMWGTYFENVYSIFGDSRQPDIIGQVETLLGGETVDFLFIDGDHRYEGVKADYENYKRFVSLHGIIGFHDINAHDNSKVDNQSHFPVEVDKLWNELVGHKVEFNTHQNWAGIGLLLL